MKGNLKILGLALMAVFGISAFVASAASAAVDFRSESSPITLTGSQEGTDVLTTHGGTVTCQSISYVGSLPGTVTPEFEVEPTFSGCSAFGLNAVIDTNGCKFQFTAGVTDANGNFEGSTHIRCPIGKAIAITAPGCTVTIGAQTPTGGTITYTNVGTGTTRELTIDLSLTGIHYIEDNVGIFQTCVHPGETTTNGTYVGHAIVTGENAAGEHRGIWIEG